jgi:Tfp pilus assembly protein PilV
VRLIIDIALLVLTAFGVVLSLWGLIANGSVPVIVLAVVLGLIALGSTAIAYLALRVLHVRDLRGTRATRWAAAQSPLSAALLELANSVGAQESRSRAEAVQEFTTHANSALHSIASAFGQVTGRVCRVTLVELWRPAGGRSEDLAVQRIAATDGVPATRGQHDWVTENTDFDEILHNGAKHFFSNDLTVELRNGYKNSHWTRAKLQEMHRTGEYPYRSTIVWPVQAYVAADGGTLIRTLGFLCVDSREAGIFDATLDVTMGELLALAFYPVWPKDPLPVESQEEGTA